MNVHRLKKHDIVLVVVDIQEKLASVMNHRTMVVRNTIILLKAAEILKLPILLTEQYPKGLGKTVQEIRDVIPNTTAIEKMSFSCCGEPKFFESLKLAAKRQVILCGMEMHVCILQTALDLLSQGYEVFVPENAVCSQNEEDRKAAFDRINQAGITPTSVESAIFELVGTAGTEEFKAILKVVK